MGYNSKTVRAKPTIWNGRRYPSKGQAGRAAELHLMHKAGVISNLMEEVTCLAVINDMEVTSWRVDFIYHENGKLILEDFKSEGTAQKPDYRMKVRIFRSLGCEVRESGIEKNVSLKSKIAKPGKTIRSLKRYVAIDRSSCNFELYQMNKKA